MMIKHQRFLILARLDFEDGHKYKIYLYFMNITIYIYIILFKYVILYIIRFNCHKNVLTTLVIFPNKKRSFY